MTFIPWNSQPLMRWASRYARGKLISLGGHPTHYLEEGEGDPVICLHGFFYDSYMWAHNLDALAECGKVYALDLWGAGYSTRQPMDYSYELYTTQLLMFMDALRIRKASFIGQSMGGGIAMLFAAQHPDRVDKLVLAAPAGLPNRLPLTGRFFALPRIGEFLLGLPTDAVRWQLLKRFWFYDPRAVTPLHFDAATRFHKIEGTSDAALAVLRRRFFDTLDAEIARLASLPIPTLLIWGRQDRSIPLAVGQELARRLPQARLEILDGAGHAVNIERAEIFNSLAQEFLSARLTIHIGARQPAAPEAAHG